MLWCRWELVVICGSLALALRLEAEQPRVAEVLPVRTAVGFREVEFRYRPARGEERTRKVFCWYPTESPEREHNYRGQVGQCAVDAPPSAGRHPLVLFSHGFFGAGDQSIFLCETLARGGYVVLAPNHADALAEALRRPPAIPNFAKADEWDERKYRDRRDDLSALLTAALSPPRQDQLFLAGHIEPRQIGALGHSLGGYTLLGMSGARQSWHEPCLRAVVLLSPYALPYLKQHDAKQIRLPTLIQGGTLDLAITPFLGPVYQDLAGSKYYQVLRNETHFGWTNLIALRQTTTAAVASGNARWMAAYPLAFFDRHLRGDRSSPFLTDKNPALWSQEHSEK